jgi:hypothetical protein
MVINSFKHSGCHVYHLLSLCLITLCHEGVWGNGCIAPPFLTSVLDAGGQLPAQAALPSAKEPPPPRYPLDWRLGGPLSRCGRCGEEKNLLSLLGIEPPAV